MKRLIAQVLSVQPLNAEMGLMQLRLPEDAEKEADWEKALEK